MHSCVNDMSQWCDIIYIIGKLKHQMLLHPYQMKRITFKVVSKYGGNRKSHLVC